MIRHPYYFGLVTVFILWASVGAGIYVTGLEIFGTQPISYLGTDDRSKFWFSGGLILAAASSLLFARSISRSYRLTKSFWTALIIGQLGQVLAAIFPYGGAQPSRMIHTVSAMILAFSIPVLMQRFAVAQTDNPTRSYAIRLFWLQLGCFILGIGAFVFLLRGAPATQMLPALAFHVWLIFFSFYNPNPTQKVKNSKFIHKMHNPR